MSGTKVYSDWLPRTTLGQRLHDLRLARGFGVRDVQAKSGVSASTVSRVERGHDLQFSQLVKLARGFSVTVIELLNGVDLSEWES